MIKVKEDYFKINQTEKLIETWKERKYKLPNTPISACCQVIFNACIEELEHAISVDNQERRNQNEC